MNPLLMLLGQQAAPEVAQGQINVVGSRSRTGEGVNYDDYVLNNTEAVRNRQADLEQTEEASQRKGMFGIKGTLRDILGLVGDAFLVQGGRNPVYAPQRERERISDAGAGFTEDPIAASERVGYYDLGAGLEMFEKHQTNELKAAQQQDLEDRRNAQNEKDLAGRYDKGRVPLTALFNQPGAYLKDGSINPAALQMAERIASQYGFSLNDYVNDNMTAEEARLFAGSGVNSYQQERLEDADRSGDQRDYSNETSRISATRPRAEKTPRAQSDREAAIAIGNKPAGQRTPGEQAFYEKYTRPPGNAKGSGLRRPGGSTSAQRLGPPRN